MFRGVNPGTFVNRPFVESYPDILPADQWTPDAFDIFSAKSIACLGKSAMLRFTAQVNLKAMAASFQETMQHRQAQAEQRRQQAMAAEARHKAAVQEVETALSGAEAHSETAVDAYNGVEAVKTALDEPHLTEADRSTFVVRLAALVTKRNQLIEKETASLAAQEAARKQRADAEEAEIAKLEDMNRQKEAAQKADAERKQRLAAAQRQAADLDEKKHVSEPNESKDGSKVPYIDEETRNAFIANHEQAIMMGTQLYVQKHCSDIEPNQDVLSSIDQSSNRVIFKSPSDFTRLEMKQATAISKLIEENPKQGLISGSPLDIQAKCGEMESALLSSGFYKKSE